MTTYWFAIKREDERVGTIAGPEGFWDVPSRSFLSAVRAARKDHFLGTRWKGEYRIRRGLAFGYYMTWTYRGIVSTWLIVPVVAFDDGWTRPTFDPNVIVCNG